MRWALGITTAKRPIPRLEETLASITLAGWRKPLVFPDRGSPKMPEQFKHIEQIVQSKETARLLGPYGNFRHALKMLLSFDPYSRLYMICQDDIEMAAGLRRWLDQQYIGPNQDSRLNNSVVSLYTSNGIARDEMGWVSLFDLVKEDRDVMKKCQGALAFIFPRDLALRFVEDPPNPESKSRTDHFVGKFCLEQKVDILVHNPSLIRHTGDTCSFRDDAPGINEHRQARVWCDDCERMIHGKKASDCGISLMAAIAEHPVDSEPAV